MNIEAFYTLSYGLYIVSAESHGKKNGYIANTAFQVTATPSQLAISCNKDNLTSEIIAESGFFSLSVLEKDASKNIVGKFGYKSGKETDKFNDTKYILTKNGVPVVTEDCVAWFECKVVQTVDVGTHLLFIGEVLDGDLLALEKEPLTYAYYREVRHGLSPKNAPTYVDKTKLQDSKEAEEKISSKVSGKSMQKWECQICDHIYDPEKGDPDSGIEPGTPFEDLPDDWRCPVCNAEKADFIPLN